MAKQQPKKQQPKKRPNPRAEARRAAERRRRMWMIGGGLAVLVLAVAIAIASTGESASRVSVDDVARDVQVSGEPLPTLSGDPADDPARGVLAPEVVGSDFDGTDRRIGRSEGPQLITFMASWCPTCQQELPILTAWLEDGGLPEAVDLIAVSTFLDDTRPNWPPQDWFAGVGFPGAVIVDDVDSTISSSFGLSGTPFWVAIDGDGQVVHRSAGLLPTSELDALVARLAES